MLFLKILSSLLFLPGNLALRKLGVTVEEDGGIMRSFVNMCFWGTLAGIIVLQVS